MFASLKWVACIVALSMISALASYIYKITNDLKKCEMKLIEANALLSLQNKEIEKNKLDIQTYKNNEKNAHEKIEKKYIMHKNIKTDQTCASELKNIESILHTFYTRGEQ